MPIKLTGKHMPNGKLLDIYLRVATDLNGGMTVPQIFKSKRYKNPKTKKPYGLKWFYYVVNKLNQLEARKEITL